MGTPPAAGGTKTPNPSWSFLWIPGSSPPILDERDSQKVQWCVVGHHERAKCDEWSIVSGGILMCTVKETIEDCIAAIVVRKALPPELGLHTHTCGTSAESSQTLPHQPRGCDACVFPPTLQSPIPLHPTDPSSSRTGRNKEPAQGPNSSDVGSSERCPAWDL